MSTDNAGVDVSWYADCCVVVDNECKEREKIILNSTPLNVQWKATFGHNGKALEGTEDEGIRDWAYWERCLGMVQLVNLHFAGEISIPAANNLPSAGMPKAGRPAVDAFGAGFDGDVLAHSVCPPDYEPDMGHADSNTEGILPSVFDWDTVVGASARNVALTGPPTAADGFELGLPFLDFHVALNRCRKLCNAQQANPTCLAFSWRTQPSGIFCVFWSVNIPSIYPSQLEETYQWCSKKQFRGGSQRNGLRYHYRGCYKLDATLANPSTYNQAQDTLKFMYFLSQEGGNAYGVESCAEQCSDHLFMTLPGGFPQMGAYWNRYHTRYIQIAGKPVAAGLPVYDKCDPAQWIRDNFTPGKQHFGAGFFIDRSLSATLCQVIAIADIASLFTAYVNTDGGVIDSTEKGNIFLPLSEEISPRSVSEPWKSEFFGLAAGGGQCLCMPSFPPMYSVEPTTANHKHPNAMGVLSQDQCDAACADGLSSCGNALDKTVFSMFVLDDRGLPTIAQTRGFDTFKAPGYSTSITSMTLGRECQYTDSATSPRIRQPPFCIGAQTWTNTDFSALPDGECHPNVCGVGSCCRTGQSAQNCPMYADSAVDVFEKPISADYKLNPFTRFTCQPRPGVRPQDPVDRLMEAEPLRYVRYWQFTSKTCDSTGTDNTNRCLLTSIPASRACNALYESDAAYFRIPVES